MPLDELLYYSPAQMLVSLDVLKLGTYQYHYDLFGVRLTDNPYRPSSIYLSRPNPNMLEFVDEQQNAF